MIALDRRMMLLAAIGCLGSALLPRFGQGAGRPADLAFAATRNGKPLGYHRIAFSEDGPRLIAEIEIAFEVKLAFIPLYRYRHRNREVWQDGRLVELATRTDDDGTDFEVEAKAAGGMLLVTGSSGRLELPGDILPSSYWDERMMQRGEWLDTQSGRLAHSQVSAQPAAPLELGGRTVDARRYDLKGDITCSLWYHEGRWVRLQFAASDGSVIEYAPADPAG